MGFGSCECVAKLPRDARAVIDDARRGALATLDPTGRPHVVPVCFALVGEEFVSAVDEKPKTSKKLTRLSNIANDERVTLLVDRWDEDWTRLAWVMVQGTARIDAPGSATIALVERYDQYRDAPPSGDVIAIIPERIMWWSWE